MLILKNISKAVCRKAPSTLGLERFAIAAALLLMLAAIPCAAQPEPPEAPELENVPITLFPHSDTAPWWISAQSNTIFQAHPAFHADYSGPNSFHPWGESATSEVQTLYLGYQLGHSRSTEALLDVESAGGHGLSTAVGLAGFTNLDVVRNPSLGEAPYISRVQLHHTFRLSSDDVELERTPLSLATSAPARRLEVRFGKIGTVDFFDVNSVGGDSHLQFMNWTVDNNGAYDYAADTRGYTYGVVIEYQSKAWGFRFGEMLMPKVANGIHLDADLARARAENYEFELRPALLKNRKSVVRLLAYENHAHMGDYRASVNRYLAGIDPRPIIQNTERYGAVKYGFGFNAEQELPRNFRAFLRLGWNEGEHESFAYTEVDSTVATGMDLTGEKWHRKLDKFGAAVVSNGISASHQSYLRDGGLGFLLGDGKLNYGRENIIESYYTAHVWRGIFCSFDLQHIWDPGYNRDRGPIIAPALRLHAEL